MSGADAAHTKALENLNDSSLMLDDPTLDIRGRKVVDRAGDEIGHVTDLFIDVELAKVRMMQIRAGGFAGVGGRHLLLPVDAITSIEKHVVHVDETRHKVLGSPAYDPELDNVPTQNFWEPYYGYYGLVPYWGNGYIYPRFPK
jgi:sporulation protein YlmC with PRC-barrel domain